MTSIPGSFEPPPTPAPNLHPARPAPVGYQLMIILQGTAPAVWRRLMVRSDVPLDEFHLLLQATMGWENRHLHQFREKPGWDSARFLTAFDLQEGEEGTAESEVRLDQVLQRKGDRIFYAYDFGDGWGHQITLEKISSDVPGEAVRTGGALACPPEDCGGIPGYEELSRWVRSGYPEESVPFGLSADEVKLWLPPGWHPDHFAAEPAVVALRMIAGGIAPAPRLRDFMAVLPPEAEELLLPLLLRDDWTEATSETIPDLPGEAYQPFVDFLELVGDGLKLTQAGRIPPAQVNELSHILGLDEWYPGKFNREDHVYPVALLHELSRHLGFVYLRKGTLLPSKAGRALLSGAPGTGKLFADKLPLRTQKRFNEDAGWITLLVAGSGVSVSEWASWIAEVLWAIGWERGTATVVLPPLAHNPTLDVLQLLVRGLDPAEQPEPERIAELARLCRVTCRE